MGGQTLSIIHHRSKGLKVFYPVDVGSDRLDVNSNCSANGSVHSDVGWTIVQMLVTIVKMLLVIQKFEFTNLW